MTTAVDSDVCLGVGCFRNHGVELAAQLLQCYPRYLEAHMSELPHQEIGRARSFSHEDLAEIQRMRSVRPAAARPEAKPKSGLQLHELRPSGRSRSKRSA